MAAAMLGGPADGPALDVGSRLTALLQAVGDAPCQVTVAWDGAPRHAYSFHVAYGRWRGIHYITEALLTDAIDLDLVATLLFEHATARWTGRGAP